MIQLTRNFRSNEVACRCGCGMLPTEHAMSRIQQLRDTVGRPLIVTAARCKTYNAEIGGSPFSKHVEGIAFDIQCRTSLERHELLEAATAIKFNGIGIGATFIHVDDREGPALCWLY